MQDFPNKPISIITGASAGGGAGLSSRLIAQGISEPLGQLVTMEYLGTGEVIAAERVAKSAPDGYTLLFGAAGLWTAPLLQKVSYDLVRDFSPVTLAVSQPHVLVVPPSLPAQSVGELLALARARPGELRYASGLAGTPSHLAGALFAYMAGVEIVNVPYDNTPILGVNDLVAGKVHMLIFSASSGIPHIKSGKLRGLAVTSTEPYALLPDLPTIAATLPGYEAEQPIGIFAPAKTPASVIERLNQEMVRFLRLEQTKIELLKAGVTTVGSSPKEFAEFVKSDTARISKLISDAGINTNT